MTKKPIKASKVVGWLFFAVIAVATVLVLLPTFGLYENSTCEWSAAVKEERNGDVVTVEGLKGVSIAIRSNDKDVGDDLREGITATIRGRGVEDIVDNPVAKRQLTVSLNELNARWTPFHSTVSMKVQAQLDLDTKRRGPRAADVTVTVDGVCNGLVKKDGFLDHPVELVVDNIVDKLLPR